MNDDLAYVTYMLDCVDWILATLPTSRRDEFFTSRLLRDAVLRNLHTLTEASLHLSDSMKEAHPEVEWKRMRGFRNMIAHNLFGLDLTIVWNLVQDRLPFLRRRLLAILAELQS